jgi:superinfection exclusion protein B
MPDFSKLVEWIKLSPKHLAAIFLFTGLVVFAPERWLTFVGIVGLPDTLRLVFGIAFLLSTILLLSAAIVAVWGMVKQKRTKAALLRSRRERLHQLSEPEKDVLRGYIEEGTRTQYLPMSDGVVGGLEAERILIRASSISKSHDHFAYNIQPWAWEYLNEHRKLLS